jgi:hypothetical protein
MAEDSQLPAAGNEPLDEASAMVVADAPQIASAAEAETGSSAAAVVVSSGLLATGEKRKVQFSIEKFLQPQKREYKPVVEEVKKPVGRPPKAMQAALEMQKAHIQALEEEVQQIRASSQVMKSEACVLFGKLGGRPPSDPELKRGVAAGAGSNRRQSGPGEIWEQFQRLRSANK